LQDYTGRAVNANNFLAALTGNKTALEPPILGQGKFSGRVIEAGPNDRLFVYYSDHGAPGVVGMPSGPFLYADQLHRSLHNRSLAGGFKETVLYIEACESGSMFQGLLEENAGVYAVTAANEMESSWGTYCPNMGTDEPPPGFNTCLGDLFSVAWLENADKEDLTQETLKKQFQLVKYRTSSNWTYSQGSHVEHFGQLSIDEELAANFEGQLNKGDGGGAPPSSSVSSTWGGGAGWLCDYWARLFGSWGESGSSSVHNEHREIEETEEGEAVHYRSVLQRDADLLHLKGEALLQEKSRRKALDDSISAAISSLWQHLTLKEPSHPGVPMLLGTSPSSATPSTIPSSVVGALMQAPLAGRMPKSPLVDDWDCLRGMVAAWESGCGKLDQYGMKHTRVFANLCNAGVNPGLLREKGEHVCNGGEEQQQQQEVLVS
jgi:legumain